MHAIQIRNLGPPLEVLEHIELPEPSAPASDQVLVGVEFAPINMNDL
jgi:NADPH:quinone reductase-like Zn-dependent oxidoreductase